MHKVVVEKECGCFRRSDLVNNMEFQSKDDALMKAIEMKDVMNGEKFCGKHEFDLVEFQDNFVINFAQQKVSGCCGGGHCN